MLLIHIPSQTDSFLLFIKSTILLSHIKNFNIRFRGQFFSLDPSLFSTPNGHHMDPMTFDPRDTAAFRQLDHISVSFRASFPSHLRNPVQDEMVDAYLYAASCAAYL